MTDQPTNQQLDEIEAKAAELRGRLDRKNPWPSDNESHWTAEGWKAGTRNALDKLHVEELVAEVRRLRATPPMVCINCETPVGWVDCPTGGWWAHETHPADDHDADPRPARQEPTAEDTLPAWLYQRFAVIHGTPPWDRLDDGDRAYWAHQAAAVRRAVARGGFKNPAPAAVPAVETGR